MLLSLCECFPFLLFVHDGIAAKHCVCLVASNFHCYGLGTPAAQQARAHVLTRITHQPVRNCGRKKKFSWVCICGRYPRAMENKFSFVIRCGTPDCECGFPMLDMGELAFKCCYSALRNDPRNLAGRLLFLA